MMPTCDSEPDPVVADDQPPRVERIEQEDGRVVLLFTWDRA